MPFLITNYEKKKPLVPSKLFSAASLSWNVKQNADFAEVLMDKLQS